MNHIKTLPCEALRPADPPTLAMKDPSHPGRRTIDLQDISNIFSSTLLHLGGNPNFEPPEDLVQELLKHIPRCPPDITTPHPSPSRGLTLNRCATCGVLNGAVDICLSDATNCQ